MSSVKIYFEFSDPAALDSTKTETRQIREKRKRAFKKRKDKRKNIINKQRKEKRENEKLKKEKKISIKKEESVDAKVKLNYLQRFTWSSAQCKYNQYNQYIQRGNDFRTVEKFTVSFENICSLQR